jgi:hypothetical protein
MDEEISRLLGHLRIPAGAVQRFSICPPAVPAASVGQLLRTPRRRRSRTRGNPEVNLKIKGYL